MCWLIDYRASRQCDESGRLRTLRVHRNAADELVYSLLIDRLVRSVHIVHIKIFFRTLIFGDQFGQLFVLLFQLAFRVLQQTDVGLHLEDDLVQLLGAALQIVARFL